MDAAEVQAMILQLAGLQDLEYALQRKEMAKSLGLSVGLLDKKVRQARQVPQLNGATYNLSRADNGAIEKIFANAAELLRHAQVEWPLRFDTFSQRPFLGEIPMEDFDLRRVAEWVQRQGVKCERKVIDDAVLYIAQENKFHEVRDWLNLLEWDAIPRIDMLLPEHAGAEDTDLHRAFMAKWMIQAVARIFDPGCQADATLLLEGPQDIGKSTFFRNLFGDRWFTDHLPSLENKDAHIQLLGIWCIEISELASTRRSDNAKVKQFLTSRDDRFRLPWDRLASQHPRQSVFGATNNPSGHGTFTDETGARRWWPVDVTYIDTTYIKDLRPQLWAEAVHRYKAGEAWHLTDDQLLMAAKEAQAERYTEDPWYDLIADYVRPFDFVTLEQIIRHALDIHKKSDWDTLKQRRVTATLKHLRWERKQRRVGDETPKRGFSPEGTLTTCTLSPVLNGVGDTMGYKLNI